MYHSNDQSYDYYNEESFDLSRAFLDSGWIETE